MMSLRQRAERVTGKDLLHFLKEWWMGHIQGEDKKYAPYVADFPGSTSGAASG